MRRKIVQRPQHLGVGLTMDDIELRTRRLTLRRLQPADAGRLAEIADDVRIARNLMHLFPHPYTIDDAVGFIGSKPNAFAIEVASKDTGLIGVIGGDDKTEIYEGVHSFGYWLGVDYWGHGYATEAGRAYLDHISQTGRRRRIEASVFGWNPASGAVLTKLGLTYEGSRANRVQRFGEVTDELLYGMTVA